MVISGSDDATLRMWDLAKSQPLRRILRAVRLRHRVPVKAVVLHRHRDHVSAITGCSNGTRWTWNLSTCRTLSKRRTSNEAAVNAIAILRPGHGVWALGDTLVIGPAEQDSVDALTVDLESEALALATDNGSTVVAATRLGLVVLDVPRL